MGEIKFSPNQQKCIDYRNRNILVSAAAGSGKTAVLVERIVKRVCDETNPCDIDRMLIVTFTKAAAAEMRERICARLQEESVKRPDSVHLERQITLVHSAQITTIDSFSLFLVRNHFNKIGLDPGFRVADEGEIKLLKKDVLGSLLEDKFAENSKEFNECVEFFCHDDRDKALEDNIEALSRFAASYPWPKEWLNERRGDYSYSSLEEFKASKCGEFLLNYLRLYVLSLADKYKEAIDICQLPAGPYMYGELFERELDMLSTCTKHEDIELLLCSLDGMKFDRLPSKKDDSVDKNLREAAKNIRDGIKKAVTSLLEKFYATPFSLSVSQSMECISPINELIDLVIEYDERISAQKRQKKIIDFNDMEHFALDILLHKDEAGNVSPTDVALEYRQYFKEIMIDEYQDSNLVQEYLLRAVSGEEDGNYNRFMVGDVKQSIYKFRLANPQLFMEKYNTYSSESEITTRIDLSQNFRSRAEVLDSVNSIFYSVMNQRMGGVEYDENQSLNLGATYPENSGCETELLIFNREPEDNKDASITKEGKMIAARIKELIKNQMVTDKETKNLRNAQYKDIVILLRTLKDWDNIIRDSLEEEGIPVYIESKTGYFKALEVQELLLFLRVLDNPRQDIPLFGALKSFFGGFDDNFIARVRAEYKNCNLYDAINLYVSDRKIEENFETNEKKMELVNDYEDGVKLFRFIKEIESYREKSRLFTIRELLQDILTNSNYLDYVTALPGGTKRRANVEMLLTKASDFEKTSYYGLFHFVRYIEQLEEYDVDYGEAELVDENANVVRLMSIHKSKGLEFPITFVAGFGKKFNSNSSRSNLIIDMNLGIAVDYVNPMRRIKNKTLRKNAILKKMHEEEMSEELRILYVALTRAKEKLIMTGAMSDAHLYIDIIENAKKGHKLSYFEFMEASNYFDFLVPILQNTNITPVIYTDEDFFGQEIEAELDNISRLDILKNVDSFVDYDKLNRLYEKFEFEYPRRDLEKLYTKTTVSELKIAAMEEKDEAAYHIFEEVDFEPYIPDFREGQRKISATVRGNAFHRVMELLDFQRVIKGDFDAFPSCYEEFAKGFDDKASLEALKVFLEEENRTLKLSDEYLEAINTKKILNFLKSNIAYRMFCASKRGDLFREQPFVFAVPATRLSEEFSSQEKVLIQGIIDVFFIEAGEIVVLDYKTDVIDSMSALWDRYKTQLEYYGESLESILNMPIKEKVLYSFYLETADGIL